MKSNKEALDVIIDIEKFVPVDKIIFKNLKIWPLIRLEIWKNLTNNATSGDPREPGRSRNKKGVKYVFSKIRIIFNYIKYNLWEKETYDKKDVVFLSAPNNKWQKVQGKYFRASLNSLQDMLKTESMQSVILDIAQHKISPVYGESRFILDRIENACSMYRMMNFFNAQQILGWDKLAEFITSKYGQLFALNKKSILERADKIFFCAQFFTNILSGIKPKVCFLECYYHPISMGYIKACHDLKIETVEIQHAQQNYNGMYCNWTKLPKKGYDLLPSVWWSWGKESADEINKWSDKIYPEHRAIVGGNPWIAKNLNGDYQIDDEYEAKLASILKGKVSIVVALQPIEPIMSSALLQAISDSPQNVNWLIRLHPSIYKKREEIEKQLRETDNKNIEIECSTKMPLFNLLKKVDFLITSWSSIVFEALLFGVHPIIIHPNGKDMFKEYIEHKIFTYAPSPEAILYTLKLDKNNFNFKEEIPYIEVDPEKIQQIIRELVHKKYEFE